MDRLRSRGRLVYPSGVEPEPGARSGRRRRKRRAYDAEASPRHFARLERAAAAARLRVPVAAVFRLSQAAQAHRRLGKGHLVGRIVLAIRGGGDRRVGRRRTARR